MSLLESIPAKHAEMPTATDLGQHGFGGDAMTGPAGFTDGIRQGEQIVMAGPDLDEVGSQPHDFPSAGRRQSLGVVRAQVIRVGFGQMGQRAQHGGRVRIDIRQRRDGTLGTGRS